MLIRKLASVAAITILGGCVHRAARPVQAPPEIAGDTPFVVENDYGDTICGIFMFPSGGEPRTNLLPSSRWHQAMLEQRKKLEIAVRPGSYQLAIAGCSMGLHALLPVTISGPTFVSVGTQREAVPPPGYRLVRTNLVVDVAGPGECRPAGASATSPGDCCSRSMDASTNSCN